MSLLQRFARAFSAKSPMMSVCVYRRGKSYFVVTKHGSRGGDPSIVAGPLEELPLNASHEELGAAIYRGLERTTHNYRYPANQQEWKQVTAPLLAAADCMTWSAFAKTASDLRVDQVKSKVVLQPSVRDPKGSFSPVPERKRELEAPSAEQLGSLVASELQFAATRDDG